MSTRPYTVNQTVRFAKSRIPLKFILTTLLALLMTIQAVHCKMYLLENFQDVDCKSRWINLKHPDKKVGILKWTAGRLCDDVEEDKGIQTSEDATSTKSPDDEGKDLVVQFNVKHEPSIDCGDGFFKLFDCGLDEAKADSLFKRMLIQDVCDRGTKKVHVILNYKDMGFFFNKEIRCKDDEFTHSYRLVVKPDNTYKVLVDGEVVDRGDFEDDWEFLPHKKIKDPEAKKPEDWDDRAKIDDVNDIKPEDWDQPEFIADPEASKPEDWDDEIDGEWEPPQINNPAYKGEWKPKQVDNPDYMGPWVPPEIDNPKYVPSTLYAQQNICAVGLDSRQVESGFIFDNILISDSEQEVDEAAEDLLKRRQVEKMKEEQDAEKVAKAKAAESSEDKSPFADASSNDLDDEDEEKHDEL